MNYNTTIQVGILLVQHESPWDWNVKYKIILENIAITGCLGK